MDIDECSSGLSNCHTYAQCANTIGSFTCSCIGLYYGDGVTCTKVAITAVTSTMCSQLALNQPSSSNLSLADWRVHVLQNLDVAVLLRSSLGLENSNSSNITFNIANTNTGVKIDFCVKIMVEDFERVKDNLGSSNFTESFTGGLVSA